jgi:antitoxin component of RelBE/YafQ-DinJ toxin-antitoxin module
MKSNYFLVVLRKGLPFPVRMPNEMTIAAMEAAHKNEDLEEVALNDLRAEFQKERRHKTSKQKSK